MRSFRNPLLNEIFAHPAMIVITVLAILAMLPMVMHMLSARKVPLRYNIRNLQNRWKTTLITALAFTLVITLLTFMLSFVKGMDRLIESSGNPGNVIVLSDGATDEAFSNLPVDKGKENLPKALQDEIKLFAKEVYVVVMYMVPNPPPGGRPRRFVQLRGLDDMRIAGEIHGVKLGKGDWPSESGVREIGAGEANTAKEIVVGFGAARTFGADLGKEILEPGDV